MLIGTWKSIALWVMSGVGFFAATWEEYFTGELNLPEINGPERTPPATTRTAARKPKARGYG